MTFGCVPGAVMLMLFGNELDAYNLGDDFDDVFFFSFLLAKRCMQNTIF